MSDTYYRYEVIYDPTKGTMDETHCFYSYGDGINVDTDNPREEGTEKKEKKITKKDAGAKLIENIIDSANSQGFDELEKKLEALK